MTANELVGVELRQVEWSTTVPDAVTQASLLVKHHAQVGLYGVERIAFLVEPRLVAITETGQPARLVPCERVNGMTEMAVAS